METASCARPDRHGEAGLADSVAMVGRERPMAALSALLAAASSGAGRAVLVLGEAGMGKTTVVRALVDRALTSGVAVVWCWCTPEAPVPYFAWRPLLRELGLPASTADDPHPGAVGVAGGGSAWPR